MTEAAANHPFALQAKGLRVSLAGREVLHGIDLDIVAGRWTCIVGPNGAGKTTLVKALAHLLPFEGHALVLGQEGRSLSHAQRARTIAWLGQNEPGAQDLLVRDVVMLGRIPHQGWLAGASLQDEQAVAAAMRETQCDAWATRPLGQLSGGERQRVLLARALAVGAPVLVMDEPLANLDPPHQADWLAIVRRHVERGGTAVTVLHELGVALHADDLVIVRDGRVMHRGACVDAATRRALEAVFDDRIAVHALQGRWVALPRP